MYEDNIVICPYCGRKHSIINKDNKLREHIYCRCKSKQRNHRVIFWASGYWCYNDDLFKMPIPC